MPGEKRKYRVTVGMAVKISKRINGAKYRVWLPYPLEAYQIRRVNLIKASPGVKYLRESLQRTAYFETSSGEIRLEFSYEIEDVAEGIDCLWSDEHIKEKPPHIVVSPLLRDIASRITEDANDDYEPGRRIYSRVTSRMRYFMFATMAPIRIYQNTQR